MCGLNIEEFNILYEDLKEDLENTKLNGGNIYKIETGKPRALTSKNQLLLLLI